MVRTIIAGIIGGIVMFLWSFVSHVVLPIGEIGVKSLPNDAVVMSTLSSNIPDAGLYIYPGMNMVNTTEGEMAAWTEKHRAGPRGILVHNPTGSEPMGASMLLTELASNIVAAIAAAFVIGWLVCNFFGRIAAAGLMGFVSWMSIDVSLWNWYGFPANYVLAQGVDQVVGWLLSGVALALLVKSRSA